MASLLLRHMNDFFGRQLKERAARNGRTAEEEHRRIVEGVLVEPSPPERHRQAVAKRLNLLLRRLNGGQNSQPEMTIARMAEYIGLNTASGLESYFFAEDEAPFDILDQISEAFGLHSDWLKFERHEPFNIRSRSLRSLHLPSSPDRENLSALVKKLEPRRVFFVRSLNEVGSATIILQVSDWRYEGFYDDWHVSNHVGATGEGQLFELWALLNLIERDASLRHITCGRDLPEKVYLDLVRGETFPGSVLQGQKFSSNWHDDFTDVKHGMPIARDGYAHYGEGFKQAQAVVRWFVDNQEDKSVP